MKDTTTESKGVKHIVGFSGGIDSQACLRFVRENLADERDIIACNSTAGENEHQLTKAFIDLYNDTVFPIEIIHATVADMWIGEDMPMKKGLDPDKPITFGDMAEIKGRFPSRKAQFCTEILKLRPQVRWIKTHFGPGGQYEGWDYIRYAGVRRDESEKRKNTPEEEWDETFDCLLRHPIADKPKQWCFDYVKQHNEPINPLYSMGFGRVGCSPCINSNKNDIREWAMRFPETIDKIRAWEKQVGRTFFPPRMTPGKHYAFVDAVVLWSMSLHGGKDLDLTVLQSPKVCSSKYGLCE